MTLRMTKGRIALAGLAIAAALALGYELSADRTGAAVDPAQIIEDRRAKMKEMGTDAKAINAFIQNGTGDAASVAKIADRMAANSKQIPDWFPVGTGEQEFPGKTRAKMEIWSDPEGFKSAANTMGVLAGKLSAA